MPCPFCDDAAFKQSFYPVNYFNNKTFVYFQCKGCNLTYLDPLPNIDDYNKMYPPSYQNDGVPPKVQSDWYQKLPGLRFSYGYQFDLIKAYFSENATILDYGCGNADFLINAQKAGFHCEGAEYSQEYVETLNRNILNIDFVTIDSLLSDKTSKKYDVIRLSNVLEHLSAPADVIKQLLYKRLSPNGIFLIEGPIEHNFSIAQAFRKIYFKITKFINPSRQITFPPYHIFFSNYKNQKSFFEKLDLKTLILKTDEDAWPFPSNFQSAQGTKQKIMALIAKVSVKTTKLLGVNWGNIFIYVGKKK